MNWFWAFCAGIYSWRQAHYSFNLAWRGSFSQINMVISFLIQTGFCFSNLVNCHGAVKQSLMLLWESSDEKWHAGAALAPQFFPSLCGLSAAVFFPSLYFRQALFFNKHAKVRCSSKKCYWLNGRKVFLTLLLSTKEACKPTPLWAFWWDNKWIIKE